MSTAVIIVIVVLVVLLLWIILSYNAFVRGRNNVEESFATMDVYLKKRYDLIPNLVETVKGYAAHERETLQNVVNARTQAMNAGSFQDRASGENALTNTLRSLFAVAENYPDLKANQNFLDLQNQLNQVEMDIANARKYYNAVVKKFNNLCETFPSNIIAKMFHFERRPMFEVDSAEERQNVKVDFGV